MVTSLEDLVFLQGAYKNLLPGLGRSGSIRISLASPIPPGTSRMWEDPHPGSIEVIRVSMDVFERLPGQLTGKIEILQMEDPDQVLQCFIRYFGIPSRHVQADTRPGGTEKVIGICDILKHVGPVGWLEAGFQNGIFNIPVNGICL